MKKPKLWDVFFGSREDRLLAKEQRSTTAALAFMSKCDANQFSRLVTLLMMKKHLVLRRIRRRGALLPN